MSGQAPRSVFVQPSAPRGGGHVVMVVFGSLALLASLLLLLGGIGALWALDERDADGYFMTDTERLDTGSRALASENLDVGTDVPDFVWGDDFADVRMEATSSEPVFIGIAPTRDVVRYLDGVGYDEITDVETDPFRVTRERHPGSGSPGRPADERFWSVQASGSGTQTISWPVESGDWSAVAMNSDGSRGVSIDTRLGARLPFLQGVAIGLFVAAGILLVLGGALLYFGLRRRRPVRAAV